MSVHRMHLSPIDFTSRSEKVYELLKEQIIQHKLRPGDKLDINALAQTLKVSRTPIKEAFNRLSSDGLITIYPQRGTYVRKLMSPGEIEELFSVRMMMELWGLQAGVKDSDRLDFKGMEDLLRHCDSLFAPSDTFDYMTFFRCDHAFHVLIVGAARNTRLSEMYDVLAVHIVNLRSYYGQPRDRALQAHKEHGKLIEALRQEGSDAMGLLTNHIEMSKRYTLALLASETGSGKDLPERTPSPVTTPS